jgi:hypothetical protein
MCVDVRNRLCRLGITPLIKNTEQQRTYNVTLRRVHITTGAQEKQQALHTFLCVGVGARACVCARLALLIQYATYRRYIVCGL